MKFNDNKPFAVNCPECSCGNWGAIMMEFDDNMLYIVAKCNECEHKFDVDYECVKVYDTAAE